MKTAVLLLASPLIPRGPALLDLGSRLARDGLTGITVGAGGNADTIDRWAKVIGRTARDGVTVLVPYSGAGPLVPAAIARAKRLPSAVIFMDAGLPHPDRARIDEMRNTLPPAAFASFEQHIRGGGAWPTWTDRDLAPLIPDSAVRARFLSLVIPRTASFFDEPLPPDDLPPDLPVAYLRLSAGYDRALAAARARGWPTRSLDLTHFAPYTHPAEVGRELLSLLHELGLESN